MIGIIAVALGIIIGVYWNIQDERANKRCLERYARQLRLRENKPKQKDYIFIGEESKMQCEYCGKEISKEEYERERHGYCDECSDDLATEEETELWGM